MQLIEHSALAAAAWLSLDVLFVIAWARYHSARIRYADCIGTSPNRQNILQAVPKHSKLELVRRQGVQGRGSECWNRLYS
jgi:hypothetical protein